MVYRYMLAVIAGVFSAMSISALHKRETDPVQTLPGYREGKDVRNDSILKGHYWWAIIFAFILHICFQNTRTHTLRLIGSIIIEYLLLISLYCLLLLLLLPFLRRTISARVCGRLWEVPVLMASIPLYFGIFYRSDWDILPKAVIYLPKTILMVFTAVWLLGFTISIFWYVFNHFRFKKRLRQNARPVSKEVLRIWSEELAKVGMDQTTPLSVTPDLQTPLVVGVRKKALEAYLPDRYYTAEELHLIFQHELRHVFRRDAEIKLAWAVIRSLLWFNPLVWVATQKAAEDLELSCDEFVLEEADEITRRRYAELLLDAAGDGRGFSTCLSSKAKTLRYRLKCVVKPGKRLTGSLVLAVLVFAFVLSCGAISFADEKGALNDFYDLEGYNEITNSLSFGQSLGTYHGVQDRTLIEYLAGLPVLRLTKPFELDKMEEGASVGYQIYDPIYDKMMWISLQDDLLAVSIGRYGSSTQYYKVVGGLDWDYVKTLHK